jgi:hypothetical protein
MLLVILYEGEILTYVCEGEYRVSKIFIFLHSFMLCYAL